MEIKITIKGRTPMIQNAFTDKAAMDIAGKTSKLSTSGDRGEPHDIAESKLYLNLDGKPCVPQPNLFRCILDAGKYFKLGKVKVTTLKSSIIPSCLEMYAVDYPIKSKKGWTVDTRPVRIPSTGGRILAHRPIWNDWQLDFEVELDTDVMGLGLFRDILDKAGRAIGLGDFRPDCKGPYGRFEVQKFVVKPVALKKAS